MSLRKAINEKCRDCIYDPKSGLGTWRQQVEGCTITGCSLHPVRPRAAKSRAEVVEPLPFTPPSQILQEMIFRFNSIII